MVAVSCEKIVFNYKIFYISLMTTTKVNYSKDKSKEKALRTFS